MACDFECVCERNKRVFGFYLCTVDTVKQYSQKLHMLNTQALTPCRCVPHRMLVINLRCGVLCATHAQASTPTRRAYRTVPLRFITISRNSSKGAALFAGENACNEGTLRQPTRSSQTSGFRRSKYTTATQHGWCSNPTPRNPRRQRFSGKLKVCTFDGGPRLMGDHV